MNAPERIHNWQTTPLSIARFAGGCKVYGCEYSIALGEENQPLVRVDVLARQKKVKRDAWRTAEQVAQIDLFGFGA